MLILYVNLIQLVNGSTLKKEVAEGDDHMVVRELTGDWSDCSLHLRLLESGVGTLICTVDKANVPEASMLWRKRVMTIASEYPDVELMDLDCSKLSRNENVEIRMILRLITSTYSWTWRKLLSLTAVARPFIKHVTGDGAHTFLWHDNWMAKGPRSLTFSPRIMANPGFPLNAKLTLSRLLNFIDGLWPSYRDERITVITTNKKDKLDATICGPVVAWTCAYTYVTANEVAEELMKSEDANIALAGVVNFLKRKKMEANKIEEENET
ncbi:hypothetical protein Vadar_009314 [Vaccinium darrowii]|uniref:Uncharacterized protein n=1 Tax=Vaccinium darrowii TaxID=229202 RepID=A0ACB7YUE6_9ERIC|nr:hypothetical protein Vadar_009314 [Vaccinium darrowii]